MKGPAVEEGIEFHLFKTAGSIQALFVASAGITGSWLAFGLGLGALQNNDVAWHNLEKSEFGTRKL